MRCAKADPRGGDAPNADRPDARRRTRPHPLHPTSLRNFGTIRESGMGGANAPSWDNAGFEELRRCDRGGWSASGCRATASGKAILDFACRLSAGSTAKQDPYPSAKSPSIPKPVRHRVRYRGHTANPDLLQRRMPPRLAWNRGPGGPSDRQSRCLAEKPERDQRERPAEP